MISVDVCGWQFNATSPGDLFSDQRIVPNSAGVYFIAAPASGSLADSHFRVNDLAHSIIYVGESYATKNRLIQHYTGQDARSNLRPTMLADLYDRGVLPSLCTDGLTSHLMENTMLGFSQPDYILDVERQLIAELQPRYNLKGCRDERRLFELRTAKKKYLSAA